MKKIFFLLSLSAALLTGCTKDEEIEKMNAEYKANVKAIKEEDRLKSNAKSDEEGKVVVVYTYSNNGTI